MIAFTKSYKTIGILGGMGPEATAEFYRRLIRLFQRAFGASLDSDFPEIIILNLPLPDVVLGTGTRGVEAWLQYGTTKLEEAGADFIVAPCNTINTFKAQRDQARIPVYSIISETASRVYKAGLTKVGVLGTRRTLRSRLYDKALAKYGIQAIKPDFRDGRTVTGIIMRILQGGKRQVDKEKLLAVITRLAEKGAEGVVLGCTELPLLINSMDTPVPLFDSLQILANVTVRAAVTGRSGVEAARAPVADLFQKKVNQKRRPRKGRARLPAAALKDENGHRY